MTYLCLVISALAALVYGLRHAHQDEAEAQSAGLARALIKTLAVGALVPLALIWQAPAPVVIGLALGAVGDFALARPGKGWFLAGMGFFALGHLAYALALWDLTGGGVLPWPVAAGLTLPLVLWCALWIAPRAGADLRWPVTGYGVIIGAMLALALGLGPGLGLVRAGAVLFVLSDLLLALRLFVMGGHRFGWVLALALWPLYWGGQLLILWGFVA